MNKPIILAINPGSTSTKIAIFKEKELQKEIVIRHSVEELKDFNAISDQFSFRKKIIIDTLNENNYKIEDLDVIIGRGGLVKPISSGVYEVNEALKADLISGVQGEHASNLGGLIASDIALEINNTCNKEVKAYIADPVVVDEMMDIARVGGNKLFNRKSIFHALNQKAVAKAYAKQISKNYEDLNFIVAHMGGGVSVGAHLKGKVVDVNQALSGEGAFSPERSGTLPAGDLVDLCFSGKYSHDEVFKMVVGKGGVVSHLDTTDIKQIVDNALAGDTKCKTIIDAFIYNVAKQIGAYSVVFKGNVDAIILTGGIAYSDYICTEIKSYVEHIAKVYIFGGEDEMKALSNNALETYYGNIDIKNYI
ncbi:MAG: butyrate kinase [Rikenellaceae bacterium]